MKQAVRIEKLKQVSDINTLSVGYYIKGFLINDVEVGKLILVERYIKNGDKILGIMNTSMVKDIIPQGDGVLLVHTENSIYKIQFIDEHEVYHE